MRWGLRKAGLEIRQDIWGADALGAPRPVRDQHGMILGDRRPSTAGVHGAQVGGCSGRVSGGEASSEFEAGQEPPGAPWGEARGS